MVVESVATVRVAGIGASRLRDQIQRHVGERIGDRVAGARAGDAGNAVLRVLRGRLLGVVRRIAVAVGIRDVVGQCGQGRTGVCFADPNRVGGAGLRRRQQEVSAVRALQHRGRDAGITSRGIDRRGNAVEAVVTTADGDIEAAAAEGYLQSARANGDVPVARKLARQELLRRGQLRHGHVVSPHRGAGSDGGRERRRAGASPFRVSNACGVSSVLSAGLKCREGALERAERGNLGGDRRCLGVDQGSVAASG